MTDKPGIHAKLKYQPTFGVRLESGGAWFSVMSRSAVAMRILFYDRPSDAQPSSIVNFDPQSDRWGDVWSLFVPGIGPGALYHLQADGPNAPEQGHRFDGKARLIDPYARALAGDFLTPVDGVLNPPKCVVVDDEFDWEGDKPLGRPLAETVIYEMHVRGFTESETSAVRRPGTYLGLTEKIPYLQALGVTAVELMPVHEFPILGADGLEPIRPNYWGYDPMAFFAPHRGFASSQEPGAQVREFKEMVRELHAAGIEVILDVVFNHTCEGNKFGPTLSFKGLENSAYYILKEGGKYENYSGCGNALNANHPVVREMILDCLRSWVINYHVDGFRFDLASILNRGRDGEAIKPCSPLVEAIGDDPILSSVKLIAEAWDADGLYQVGGFGPTPWAEWNGKFRDDMRCFWKGDSHKTGAFATRLAGSSDLFKWNGRNPFHSVNFITSHDGFSLNDLVSYNEKHNEANLEGNRDGENNNYSYNYGEEGPSGRPEIEATRLRQIKNMLTSLFLSQGVPMLRMGDEYRHTQDGNNNVYCQDNPLSWFDWQCLSETPGLFRFCKSLIDFRLTEPTLRRRDFLSGHSVEGSELPEASWYGPLGEDADWDSGERCLTCLLGASHEREDEERPNHHILFMTNVTDKTHEFLLPSPAIGFDWRKFIDTGAPEPNDIFPSPSLNGPIFPLDDSLRLTARRSVVYVAQDVR